MRHRLRGRSAQSGSRSRKSTIATYHGRPTSWANGEAGFGAWSSAEGQVYAPDSHSLSPSAIASRRRAGLLGAVERSTASRGAWHRADGMRSALAEWAAASQNCPCRDCCCRYSNSRVAAVDGKNRARDVARGRCCQEGIRCGDLIHGRATTIGVNVLIFPTQEALSVSLRSPAQVLVQSRLG